MHRDRKYSNGNERDTAAWWISLSSGMNNSWVSVLLLKAIHVIQMKQLQFYQFSIDFFFLFPFV